MANPEQNHVVRIADTIQTRDFAARIDNIFHHGINKDRFLAAAATALRKSSDVLVSCTQQSIYNAIADAAQRGLVPDGRLGALVPYYTRVKRGDQSYQECRAQFLIMPEGIIECAARVGAVLYAVSVYEDDLFRAWNDETGQHIEHKYRPFGDRGKRVGAFAIGKIKTGQVYVEAMSMDELGRARETTKSRNGAGQIVGPWIEWPERMEQKTVMHRLHKRMPGIPVTEDEEYTEPRDIITISPAPPRQSEPAPRADQGQGAGKGEASARPRGLQRVLDAETGAVVEDKGGGKPTETKAPIGETKASAAETTKQAGAGEPF